MTEGRSPLRLGETIRNVALLALIVFVVGPCTYNMLTAPDEDEALLDQAAARISFVRADAVIVEGLRERAVCGRSPQGAFVYRESGGLVVDTGGDPVAKAGVDGWCREKGVRL